MTNRIALLLLGAALLPLAACGGGGPVNRTETGTLQSGDETLNSGEFADSFTINVPANQYLIADLTSTEFDPYLIVRPPSCAGSEGACPNQLDNDDHEGSQTRSLLSTQATEGGRWQVIVTSFQPGETGAYTLNLRTSETAPNVGTSTPVQNTGGIGTDPGGQNGSGFGGDAAPLGAGGQNAIGPLRGVVNRTSTLAGNEPTRENGQHYDDYTFTAEAGQVVTVDLRSTDFDPYLIGITPSGREQRNDDYNGSRQHSRLDTSRLPETGTYTVRVSSFSGGATGSYTLTITPGDAPATAQSTPQPPSTSSNSGAAAPGDRVGLGPINSAQRLTGRLEQGDRNRDGNKFTDAFLFDGQAGQRLIIELTSTDFDPFLLLRSPDGNEQTNDDYNGSRQVSRLEVTLPQAGRYAIGASSFAAGSTGSYQLTITPVGGGAAPSGK